MYRKILVALDHTPADATLLPHVCELAQGTGAELLLVHVADGWAAQWREHVKFDESSEVREDGAYLAAAEERLRAEGFTVSHLLPQGDPASEILKIARDQGCDLIALSTHGHRFVLDVLLGSTIEKVRHNSRIPVLVVPVPGKGRGRA